jgi:siroheme synthase-like protein
LSADLFPLFLRLEGRRVLVVGGGEVGERKVHELLAAGADVTVVAKSATARLVSDAGRRRITLHLRAFSSRDVDGVWLVIAATSDAQVNGRVARAAERRCVFVNAVDDPDRCSALFGSILRRPPFTVAISSRGETPALSRLLREILEQVLPEERWVERARALRARWKAKKTPMASRFGELVSAFAADFAADRPRARKKRR